MCQHENIKLRTDQCNSLTPSRAMQRSLIPVQRNAINTQSPHATLPLTFLYNAIAMATMATPAIPMPTLCFDAAPVKAAKGLLEVAATVEFPASVGAGIIEVPKVLAAAGATPAEASAGA